MAAACPNRIPTQNEAVLRVMRARHSGPVAGPLRAKIQVGKTVLRHTDRTGFFPDRTDVRFSGPTALELGTRSSVQPARTR
jgi:hypothetical protein